MWRHWFETYRSFSSNTVFHHFLRSAPPTCLLRPAPLPGAQLFCAPRPLRPCAPAHPGGNTSPQCSSTDSDLAWSPGQAAGSLSPTVKRHGGPGPVAPPCYRGSRMPPGGGPGPRPGPDGDRLSGTDQDESESASRIIRGGPPGPQ
jgi:hypothetical protein